MKSKVHNVQNPPVSQFGSYPTTEVHHHHYQQPQFQYAQNTQHMHQQYPHVQSTPYQPYSQNYPSSPSHINPHYQQQYKLIII